MPRPARPPKPLKTSPIDVVAIAELLPHEQHVLARVRRLGVLLDDAFELPGTGMRFGLDGLLGLIPGVGDTATLLLGAWLVREATHLGLPRTVIARMLANIGIDWAVGAIPLLGDVFDFAFKAHRKNLRLIEKHLQQRTAAPRGTR